MTKKKWIHLPATQTNVNFFFKKIFQARFFVFCFCLFVKWRWISLLPGLKWFEKNKRKNFPKNENKVSDSNTVVIDVIIIIECHASGTFRWENRNKKSFFSWFFLLLLPGTIPEQKKHSLKLIQKLCFFLFRYFFSWFDNRNNLVSGNVCVDCFFLARFCGKITGNSFFGFCFFSHQNHPNSTVTLLNIFFDSSGCFFLPKKNKNNQKKKQKNK